MPALTGRQLEIVSLVGRGLTNREIAEHLEIRPATVKRHLERIYDRTGVRSRAAVVARYMQPVAAPAPVIERALS